MAALADALERPVERSDQLEATTRGAGYLAGLATGTWSDEAELASLWSPAEILEPHSDPALRRAARERYLDARGRAERTIPDLSAVSF
jgi:glycerol kinase